jgi:hypothetical protein
MIAAEIELTLLTRRVEVEEAARVLLIRKDRGWKEVVAMLDGQAAASRMAAQSCVRFEPASYLFCLNRVERGTKTTR